MRSSRFAKKASFPSTSRKRPAAERRVPLAQLAPNPAIPKSFDELCEIVEQVEGVRFRELFERIAGPDADGDAVLQEVLKAAVEEGAKMAKEAKRQDEAGESS